MSGLHLSLVQSGPVPLAARFSCAPGEVLALVGPSGAGKTTILRSIAGTCRPAGGQITVNDEVWFDSARGIWLSPRQRKVGMVFQNYALFPHMTALGNVMAAMQGVTRPLRAGRARDLLALLHLKGLEARRPAELSGGQQQRVALARALAREPAALLLDEPFSAVDRATREGLYTEIAALRERLRMPVVLVSHDLDEAMMLADRMVVLAAGHTLQEGSPAQVRTRPASLAVASLLGLGNRFSATVAEPAADTDGEPLIEWSGHLLRASHCPGLRQGQQLGWVIADGFVIAGGEGPNRVTGRIVRVQPIGATVRVTLQPAGGDEQLSFSVAAWEAANEAFIVGQTLSVRLLPAGIHLLPG